MENKEYFTWEFTKPTDTFNIRIFNPKHTKYAFSSVIPFELKIELLEIPLEYNPSDLIFEIVFAGQETKLRLYQYRAKFILQNNLYILDTQNIPEFTIKEGEIKFTENRPYIGIKGLESFKVKMYGYFEFPD